MKKILEASPEALNEKDPTTGNGVLHNAMYKKPLIALLQLKVCINKYSSKTVIIVERNPFGITK